MRRTLQPPTKGRCVCVIGPPRVGVTTLVSILAAEAKTPCRVASGLDLESVIEAVEKVRGIADVVFVDGWPRGPEDVKRLVEAHILGPRIGCVVLVMADRGAVARRVKADVIAGWDSYYSALPLIEDWVRLLDVPFFCIHNDEAPDVALADLARRSRIRD